MSLSAWEQQALDSIEDELAGSDPKLASLLATFARLASREEMPVREKIRNQSLRRGNVRRDARRLFPRLGWQQTMLLLWLAVTIALVAVALVLNRDSRNGPCTESWGVAVICAQQAPAHSPRPAAHKTAARQVRRATEAIVWLTTPGPLMTDAVTQTGWAGVRVSAAALRVPRRRPAGPGRTRDEPAATAPGNGPNAARTSKSF